MSVFLWSFALQVVALTGRRIAYSMFVEEDSEFVAVR